MQKTFIIINGKKVHYLFSTDKKTADIYAKGNCDHKKEIIVREVEHIIR